MKSIISSLIIFFVSSLFVAQNFAQEIDSTAANKLSQDFFSLMNSDKFDEAAKLFHYPPNYTKKELELDIATVSKILQLFLSEFGTSTLIDTTLDSMQTAYVSVGGGNLPYWSKYPTFFFKEYPVVFKKEGFGYIKISFCNLKKICEIREVTYVLPKSHDGVELKMTQIMMKMFQINQEMQTEEKSKEI